MEMLKTIRTHIDVCFRTCAAQRVSRVAAMHVLSLVGCLAMATASAQVCDIHVAVGRNGGDNMRWAVHDDAAGDFAQLVSEGEGWGNDRSTAAIAFGDVDGDGRLEVAIGRNSGGNMRWAIHDDAEAGFVQLHSDGEGWGDDRGTTALAFGDTDGDGRDELAVGRNSGGNMRWAIHDDAEGGFAQLHAGGEDWGDDRGTTALAFGDVDGDGRDELAVGRNSGGNMRWAIHDDADAGFVQLHAGGEDWGDDRGTTRIAIGNVDDDERAEIAIGRNDGDNMRWAVHDDAAAGFVQLHSDGEAWGDDRRTTALAFGDVDGDAREEIAVGRNDGGNMRWAIHDDAEAGFAQLHSDGEAWGNDRGTTALAIGDVDGDGRAEIAVGRNSGGNMRWAIHDDAEADFVQLHSDGEGWGDDRGTAAIALAVPRRTDTDGDGLLDVWESNGIDFDCDGQIDLDLPAMGAEPERKDLFVEVDYMQFHEPMPQAIQDVVDAFANAPVSNPDGSTGISLRAMVDEQIPHQNDITTWSDVDTIMDASFGTPSERSAPNAEAILGARALAFRYALFAHRRDGDSSSGRGGGARFVVTLGASNWGIDPVSGHNVGTELQQAGTFMHELGHTLGLGHGGGDGSNCKPNYLSVMSYNFQTQWIVNRDLPAARLDYSRQALLSLDESALNESAGIADGTDQTEWSPDNGTTTLVGWGDGALNWDGANPFPDPGTVAVDVNNRSSFGCGASPNETLAGFDDWSNLRYRVVIGQGEQTDPPEMTDDDAQRRRRCAANDTTPRCRPLGFEYVAKLVCGRQTDPDSLMVARGHYATALNIHNPHNRDVRFWLKAALGLPPGDLMAGRQYRIGEGELSYDDVITADCDLLRRRIFQGALPAPLIDGMFVLQSSERVDVRAVYTTAALTPAGDATTHSSIQVLEVSEHRTEQPETPRPDLMVSDIDMSGLTVSCPQGAGSCVTTVRATITNAGAAPAGISTSNATLDPSQSVNVPRGTPQLAPGASTVIRFRTPPGGNCFDPDCTVCVTADMQNRVDEGDETNNRMCRTRGG